ncbi:unnamed protein product [Diamesa serratosioi]
MEVVAISGGNAPFKREVHEWQHIDAKTGALLSGFQSSDRFVNGNLNSYGKTISQNVSTTDGTQHSQHKQMNILQTRTSNGGALQVVRAQTVQTSSSRRAMTTTSSFSSQFSNHNNDMMGSSSNQMLFGIHKPLNGDLLSINPRSSLLTSSSTNRELHHQQQQTATKSQSPTSSRIQALLSSSLATGNSSSSSSLSSATVTVQADNYSRRNNQLFNHNDTDVGILQQQQQQQQQSRQQHQHLNKLNSNNARENLSNASESASIEELTNLDDGNSFDGEATEWKRVSKIRRSLQFPKTSDPRRYYTRPPDLPENSVNVLKIKQEIENGRRLNTAMRNNHVDLVALDSILKNSPTESLASNQEPTETKSNCITADSLKEIRRRLRKLSNEFLYKDDMSSIDENNMSEDLNTGSYQTTTENSSKSLELRNRSKERELGLEDWHNRRKSYGFEKMFQPTDTFSNIESSTDSGIGRSSDLASNWSPTVDTQRTSGPTIIKFGDKPTKPASTSICLFNGSHLINEPLPENKPAPMRRSFEKKDELKRHSIAVDESRFVDEHYQRATDRKTSMVHLNGNYEEKYSSHEGILDENARRQKRVEFCKTEIHFAAESGRVNIVETDGKPPPTTNFRRRRRSSGGTLTNTYVDAIGTESPLLQIKSAADQFDVNTMVTTTIGSVFGGSNDDTDDQSEDGLLRGILKNKPVKPKPYHLGENMDNNGLWGVRLKHVENQHSFWRSSIEVEPPKSVSTEDALEQEFKNLVDRVQVIDDEIPSATLKTTVSNTTGGYSTRISLSAIPTTQSSKDTALPTTFSTSHTTSAFTNFNNKDNNRNSSTAINLGSLLMNDPNAEQKQTKYNNDRLKGTKISIDLKLPHPNSINLMDELKSTSLIIKTMRTTNYFDDAVKQLEEQDSPLIRSSSLRLNLHDNIPKSSSTNNMFRKKPEQQTQKYSSSLDGDRGILDGNSKDEFEFLNGFLEDNRKFEIAIAQKENSPPKQQQPPPIAAPRFKKIMNSNVLSHQLLQLKQLYDQQNDSDDNADAEVKSFLSTTEEKAASELSGSWSRVRVKKIANSYQTEGKWSTKVNIQNFESRSPALSRSNSLRVKKSEDLTVPTLVRKLSTGTRQLRDHELTYFGISKTTSATTPNNTIPKSHTISAFAVPLSSSNANHINTSFTHLASSKSSSVIINSSSTTASASSIVKPLTNKTHQPSSTIIINTKPTDSHNKPDLIMHSQKYDQSSAAVELTQSQKKSLIDALDECLNETNGQEPLYENIYANNSSGSNNSSSNKLKYNRKLDLDRDEKILDELTRAADEIMNTCKEMYHADNEEKRRKSLLGNNNSICLETIAEGKQQPREKVMKSKGVQVSRNFEDSLRRYHPRPQRTSSQSSIESLPRTTAVTTTSKVSTSSSIASRPKRLTASNKSGESTSTTLSSTRSLTAISRKRESGGSSDSKQRVQRVSSRERMQHQSNASSSEDLPNSSVETPRRPRRTKLIKSDKPDSATVVVVSQSERKSRLTRIKPTESSLRRQVGNENNPHVTKMSTTESKSRSSTTKSSSHNPNSSTTSPGTPNVYVSQTLMIPPRRRNHLRKVIRRNSSLKAREQSLKRRTRITRRTQLESCICS